MVEQDGDLVCIDNLTPETVKQVKGDLLEDVYYNGRFLREQNFEDIRALVAEESNKVYGQTPNRRRGQTYGPREKLSYQ